MQAIEAIKQLQGLDPNEEIVIMYWTKELFDDNYDEENAISKDTWNDVVITLEGSNDLDGASGDVYDAISDKLSERGVEQ